MHVVSASHIVLHCSKEVPKAYGALAPVLQLNVAENPGLVTDPSVVNLRYMLF
jgi:hypothetical protein